MKSKSRKYNLVFALGIAAEIFCEATNKRLQRIARPEGERPNLHLKNTVEQQFIAFLTT
jgi:hypothetical protein